MICRKCNKETMCEMPVVFRDNTVHIERRCFECGAHNGYAPQEISIEKAEQEIMPFGKHKGLTMGTLATIFPDYLRWARKNLDSPRIKKIINVLLPENP